MSSDKVDNCGNQIELHVAKLYVSEIRSDQEVETHLVVAEKQLRVARNGTRFLTLKLADKSGEITGRVWERAEELMAAVPSRGPVFIRARSETFRDELQLQIQEIVAVPREQIDPADFLPVCPVNIDQLFETLKGYIATVKRRPLQRLMKAFLGDRELVTRFKQAPAAKSIHHAYLGGLLEHTVSVIGLIVKICDHYPALDKDMLIAGAIWHDVGKIEEFSYDLQIDYSHVGRLVGHIGLGLDMLNDKLRTLKAFPAAEAMLLKHLILSHHGDSKFGAVKLPMTREALVLHFADDVDAKMNYVTRILSDPAGQDQAWTPYQPLFERFFFRGLPDSLEELPKEPEAEEARGLQLNIWGGKGEKLESRRRRSEDGAQKREDQ